MIKIIFVCHGNICRSPACEYVFKQLVKAKKLDSKYECYSRALTNEEIGNDIYPPMKEALNRAKIPYLSHQARRLDDLDVQYADYIVYMDDENKWMLDHDYCVESKKLIYLADYIDQNEISDPWYHHRFDYCLNQIIKAINKLLNHLEQGI